MTGIIINALSISLSAATSLDWKLQITHDNELITRLQKVASCKGEEVILVRRGDVEDGLRMRRRE